LFSSTSGCEALAFDFEPATAVLFVLSNFYFVFLDFVFLFFFFEILILTTQVLHFEFIYSFKILSLYLKFQFARSSSRNILR